MLYQIPLIPYWECNPQWIIFFIFIVITFIIIFSHCYSATFHLYFYFFLLPFIKTFCNKIYTIYLFGFIVQVLIASYP